MDSTGHQFHSSLLGNPGYLFLSYRGLTAEADLSGFTVFGRLRRCATGERKLIHSGNSVSTIRTPLQPFQLGLRNNHQHRSHLNSGFLYSLSIRSHGFHVQLEPFTTAQGEGGKGHQINGRHDFSVYRINVMLGGVVNN